MPVTRPGIQRQNLWGYGAWNYAFAFLQQSLVKGFWRTLGIYIATYAIVVLTWAWRARVFTWKVWRFLRWRFSRRISADALEARNGICDVCPRQVVVHDNRYKHSESRYCGACGCSHNRWSELRKSKNRRKGHICPAYKFPEQAEQLKQMEEATKAAKKPGGCKGCGSDKTQPTKPAAPNGRGHKLEDWHRNNGLLAVGMRPNIGE